MKRRVKYPQCQAWHASRAARCTSPAKYLAPIGALVCGTHRRAFVYETCFRLVPAWMVLPPVGKDVPR